MTLPVISRAVATGRWLNMIRSLRVKFTRLYPTPIPLLLSVVGGRRCPASGIVAWYCRRADTELVDRAQDFLAALLWVGANVSDFTRLDPLCEKKHLTSFYFVIPCTI